MRDQAEGNPYEPPQNECISRNSRTCERESLNALGCFFLLVSVVVFFTVNDLAQPAAAALHFRGLTCEGNAVRFAPFFVLTAWLLVFHLPIGKRLRLARLRAVRHILAIYRYLILWIALSLVGVVSATWLSPR
jgi:succinate dehydrogenase/fumarate reductase cytochrome b subunit